MPGAYPKNPYCGKPMLAACARSKSLESLVNLLVQNARKDELRFSGENIFDCLKVAAGIAANAQVLAQFGYLKLCPTP